MALIGRIFLFILFLAVGAALMGLGLVRGSLPDYSGTIEVAGPLAPIVIARDSHAVPHVSAASEADLAFGLGYAHAQDRLFQMDINRRIGRGRMAEILGTQGLGIDRYFRTLGFAHAAESAFAALPGETQALLQAYAAGANAFMRNNRGPLPPEFLILGYRPEFWSPVDTLVWQKMMWFDLSGNARHEVARAQLLTKLTPAQVTSLYPTYEGDSEPPLPTLAGLMEPEALNQLAALLGPEKPPGYGSNNWVVSGAHTKSGKPLLANDPHLGLTTPSIWYLARLHNTATGENVVGVTFPGTPAIILGRNDHIAWGFTNTFPDSQDLFVEKLVGETHYLTPDGPKPFDMREEVIHVRGGAPVHLTVRSTRHGPVVSDVQPGAAEILGDGHVVALQWTALEAQDEAPVALRVLNTAKTFDAFLEAGKHYFGPQQNMIYADTAGNIGYFAPAKVPVRRPDNRVMGRLPSPGWEALYDWQGYIPIEDLPLRFNPKSGIIATANEKIVDDDYPHFLTRDWSLPYRGNRIRAVLSASDQHDIDSFAALHADIVSDMARDLLPWMLAAVGDHPLAERLKGWDGAMDKDLAEPLIFQTWVRAYYKRLVADELDELFDGQRRLRPQLIKSGLYWEQAGDTLPADDTYYALPVLDRSLSLLWCDDVTTVGTVETCLMLAREALDEAEAILTARYGSDANAWRWGTAHQLTQGHRPFGQLPYLRDIFSLSGEQSGGRYTINVAGNSTSDASPHLSSFGASYRGIFDFSDLNRSRFVQPTGQSGHPLSPYFGDQFPLWQKTEGFEIPTDTPLPRDLIGVLELRPAR